MLDGALHLLQQRVQPARDAVLVHVGGDDQCGGIAHQKAASGAGGEIRRIGLPAAFVQAAIEHAGEQRIDQQAAVGRAVVADLRRHLVVQGQPGEVHLGIGGHADPEIRVRGDGEPRSIGRRIGAVGPRIIRRALRRRREVLADQGFHLVRIEIADRDHRHEVGPVPAFVEAAQVVGGCGLDDLRQADRQPHRVLGVAEQHRELLVADALVGTLAQPPLLKHHAAFALHLVRVQGNRVRPFAEDVEALRDYVGVGGELQEVHGLIEAGIGVEVRPECGAYRLQVIDDLVARERGGAVEGHMLQEVRQAALGLLLQHGSCAYAQP